MTEMDKFSPADTFLELLGHNHMSDNIFLVLVVEYNPEINLFKIPRNGSF